MSRVHLLVLFWCITVVKGDSWDDFANNLATDLAPLIQLFGEQATKQFLSESIGRLDNIIFACAPLGILTAVVSAIRVCGSPSLKAFIGRAQESAATSEVELLSSTSGSTAELWNEGGITRVFGRPQISEFVYAGDEVARAEHAALVPDDGKNKIGKLEDKGGIQRLDDVFTELRRNVTASMGSPFNKARRDSVLPTDQEPPSPRSSSSTLYGWKFAGTTGSLRKKQDLPEGGPNLSFNVGIRRLPSRYFYAAASLGLVLQIMVLVFAAITVWVRPDLFQKNGAEVPSYGFPCSVTGTVLVCVGMFLCAFLIDQSTIEDCFIRDDDSQVWWVQPGGQKVGDQVLDAFVGKLESNVYIRSRKEKQKSQFTFTLWLAVGMAIAGFVIQFVGLRALHSSVTLFQLGSTLLMSTVRAALRTSRMKLNQNVLSQASRDVSGHELDCLAQLLAESCDVRVGPAEHMDGMREWHNVRRHQDAFSRHPRPNKVQKTADDFERSRCELLKVRARIGELHKDTFGPSETARSVKAANRLRDAIEETMESLESWSLSPADEDDLTWSWNVGICDAGSHEYSFEYPLRLYRETGASWKIRDLHELEAIVGLWSWTLVCRSQGSFRIVIDGTNPKGYGLKDYEAWIQRRMTHTSPTIREKYPDYDDIAGFPRNPRDEKNVLVKVSGTMERRCAQDLYILFLDAALKKADKLRGKLELRSGNTSSRALLKLQNSRVESLAEVFERTLGTREEAYMTIIPTLMHQSKLPTREETYILILKQAIRDDDQKTLRLLMQQQLHKLLLNGNDKTALHSVADGQKLSTAQILIDDKMDVNARTKLGWTPLHYAARFGKLPMVKLLLDNKADINSCTKLSETPLYIAIYHKEPKIAKYLLTKKADPNLMDVNRVSPLMRAIFSSKKAVVRALLDAHANKNIKDLHGWTPAHAAWAMKYSSNSLMLKHFKTAPHPMAISPTQWDSTTHNASTFFSFSDDGLTAVSLGKDHHKRQVKSDDSVPKMWQIHSNHPIPIGLYTYYFEVSIEKLSSDASLSIGLSAVLRDQDAPIPGWTTYAWGYYSKDGRKLHGTVEGFDYGPKFGAGDTIGCGVDFKTWTCFFTKNGEFLSTAFWKLKGRLWPVIGVSIDPPATLRANFEGPFMWNGTYSGPARKARRLQGDTIEEDSLDFSQNSANSIFSTSDNEWTDDSFSSDTDGSDSDDDDEDDDDLEDSDTDSDSTASTSESDDSSEDSDGGAGDGWETTSQPNSSDESGADVPTRGKDKASAQARSKKPSTTSTQVRNEPSASTAAGPKKEQKAKRKDFNPFATSQLKKRKKGTAEIRQWEHKID